MTDLGKRIGYGLASRLMGKLREEQRLDGLGLREADQPSEAATEITRALNRSEFTSDERAAIRSALGIELRAEEFTNDR